MSTLEIFYSTYLVDTSRSASFTTFILPIPTSAKMFAVCATLLTLLATTLAAPISLSVDVSWSYNVLMTAGSAQFAVWVPTDGNAYSTSSLTCLDVGASSTGSCAIANVDQVGVASGYTCAFAGSNGWSGAQTGTGGSGWLSVAPPQNIASVACVANSS